MSEKTDQKRLRGIAMEWEPGQGFRKTGISPSLIGREFEAIGALECMKALILSKGVAGMLSEARDARSPITAAPANFDPKKIS